MNEEETSVLVVGGSLVGLSAAMFLAARGVKTIVVERHTGSSPHPRAIGYTQRTMEMFRAVGLAERVPQAPPTFHLRRVKADSLAGTWTEGDAWTPTAKAPLAQDVSPCGGAAIAQDKLEPLLRDRARELGAELRLGTELVRFEQDDDGVTAWVRAKDGRETAIRAAYLLAADGAKSPIREALGITRSGRGPMRTLRSVLFRAPLDEYLTREARQWEIEQPDLRAFLTTYNDGRWVLMFDDDRERSGEELTAAIVKATGRPDLAASIEILATGRWELQALVADRFSSGRVFLMGDAAHALPPSRGGYGANTGIHDAYDVAWKIASVLSGVSRPELLSTYDAERRPAAWRRHQQIFARPDYAKEGGGIAEGEPIYPDEAMELGQLYRSDAILGAGPDLPPAAPPSAWRGQPGTRAPHLWVSIEGERASTLDCFGRGWVLVASSPAWTRAIEAAYGATNLRVAPLVLPASLSPDDAAKVAAAFGLEDGGAALVRPDGVVAFRSPTLPADPGAVLTSALSRTAFARERRS